ncbi:MAG: hypothetical protein ABSG59_22235, partial [Verrucomicrobiota bacterium]
MKTLMHCKPTFFIAALGTFLISSADAATISWTNVNGGNWSAPANWSPNEVPGGSDDAFITNAGTYTVTLDTSRDVNSLSLGGGAGGQQTLSMAGYALAMNSASVVTNNGVLSFSGGYLAGGPLTVSGLLDWTGGYINGNCVVSVATNGVLTLAGLAGYDYDLFGIVSNAGTMQLVSGDFRLNAAGGTPATLVNLPEGVVEMTSDVTIDQAYSGTFVNQGTLVKSGGTGTSTIVPYFSNSGTVEANTGTISINGLGAAFNTGSLFIGAGQTALNGNTVTFNGSLTSSNLVLAGAAVQGNCVLNGLLVWTSGYFNGNTVLTVPTNSVVTLAGLTGYDYDFYGTLSNAGTMQLVSGDFRLNAAGGTPATLVNLPGGVVEMTSDVTIDQAYSGTFVNQGTLVKSGGTGTSTIVAYFSNSGTVEANTGVISINGLGATFNTGSLFIGAGQTALNSSTVTFNGSLTSSNLVLAGAVVQGEGVLNGLLVWTSGYFNGSCVLTVAAGSVLTLDGAVGDGYSFYGILTNAGTMRLVSGDLVLNQGGSTPGVLVNLPGAILDLAADGSIVPSYSPYGLLNQGTLVKSGGTGTSTISVPFVNTGTVEANTGLISIAGGATLNTGSLFIGAGQTALAAGTVNLNGTVTSSNLALAGADLAGNGVLSGVLTWTGGQINGNGVLTVAANSVLTLEGTAGGSYSLFGIVTNAGTVRLVSGTLLLNQGGATPGTLVNL